ncbi:MAG: phosphotransferase [Microbacteriaceae bacterium]|nr:phosphotransferase [Microbacteriaceae bacterium]MCL2795637.1 phosphotransferase [Microbacteriaceae bacterium]
MPVRTQWSDLPPALTQWVEQQLGAPIVRATTQLTGFSSGSADLVETRDGRRAFVKAVSRHRNAITFEIHRTEAAVMRMLPAGVRVPELLGVFDDDEWVALLLAAVDGEHPGGRGGADIPAVLDALAQLPPAHGELSTLPRVRDELAEAFNGWSRLAADGADSTLPPLALALRDRMAAAAAGGADAVDGEHLVHQDCRADNVLIDRTGAAWVIDWPWASIGARWLDGLTYLLDVVLRGEPVDVDEHLGHPIFDGMSPDDADAVLAGLAGAWYDLARQPASPDMPTIRAFQRTEADAAVTWLSRRWAKRAAGAEDVTAVAD